MDKPTEMEMKRQELESSGKEVLAAVEPLDEGVRAVVTEYVQAVNNQLRDVQAYVEQVGKRGNLPTEEPPG